MVKHDFRHDARLAVQRSEALMAESDGLPSLRYAALEARLAMEALTYDRAQAYRDELSMRELETWQPRKVMMALLEIDPLVDAKRTISITRSGSAGANVPDREARVLGTDMPLNLKTLRTHYDAIGSYLHQPTLGALDRGDGPEASALAARLTNVLTYLQAVLASKVFNFTVGQFSELSCFRCNSVVRRRLPRESGTVAAKCLQCEAAYTVVRREGDVVWTADDVEIPCANKKCGKTFRAFRDDVQPGMHHLCEHCGRRTQITFAVQLLPKRSGGA